MFRPDPTSPRPPARASRLASGLVALLLGIAAAPVVGAAESPSAPPAPTAAALLERYEAEALSDAVLFRPRDRDSAVRSIEVTEDGEVLVNGKQFDQEELTAFLGQDGRLFAELSELGFDEAKVALGLARVEAEPENVEVDGHSSAEHEDPDHDIDIDIGVAGGPRVRVSSSRDDRVSIGNSIRIAKGETAHEAVCVLCSVDVEGEVFSNVVAVGGSVRVTGTVHGDAVAVGGGVDVGEDAEVGGEAVAVGGVVNVEDGGEVHGQRSSVGVGGPFFGNFDGGWDFPFGVFSDFGRLVAAIFRTGLLALLGILVLMTLRPAVERASRRATEEPWRAVFAGLLVQLFFLPVLVLVSVVLAVSVIGIPLLVLVPVALLAFVISALVGFVAVGRVVGRWAERRFGGRFTSEILTVVVGVVLIQATSLIGRLVSLPGGWLAAVGFTVVALGFFLKYISWTIGMGAMTLVAFGRDWRRPLPPPAREEESEDDEEDDAAAKTAPGVVDLSTPPENDGKPGA